MKTNKAPALVIGALVALLILLCAFVPGFAGAVFQVLYCSFANVTCVKVLP